MKKSFAVGLALSAIAGAALAQSSVTAFGVVDVNARSVDNGGIKQTQLSNDGNQSSRIGFRGIEDLGGGLKAGFWLESAVNADTGTANASRFWHRRATVSLISNTYGEIRLGRDQVPTWTILAEFDPFNVVGVATSVAAYQTLGGIDTRQRADNAVSYFLPATLGGVYGQVTVAAGEGTPGKKYTGGRIGYRAGPVNVSGAYSETDVVADKVKLGVVAASYDFGVARLVGTFTQQEYLAAKDRNSTVAVVVPVGAWQFKGQFTQQEGSGSLANKSAKGYGIGAQYDLSKRSALYANYGRIENEGVANYTVAAISGVTLGAGKRSEGYELGLRHSF